MRADSLEHLTRHFEREGWRFALSPECPDAELLADVAMGLRQPERWFKRVRRRIVMLAGGMVVKLYDFRKLSDLLHSRRYGPREVECYHDYAKAFGELPGFRVPRLWGYFERPVLGGLLHRANGIVDEYVPGTREMTAAELMRTPALFAHLYRRGIYHPDMQFKNVLWQPETQTLLPIDYMGCNFLPVPNWEALLMELASFLHTAPETIALERAKGFVAAVLEALPELRLPLEDAWRCLEALRAYPIETHQYHHPIFLPPELRRRMPRLP